MKLGPLYVRLFTALLLVVIQGPPGGTGAQRWWGRTCCEHSLNNRCKSSCRKAKSPADLSMGCNDSDEYSLMRCAVRQDAAQKCCYVDSENISNKCQSICRSVAMGSGKVNVDITQSLSEHCGRTVAECFNNYTQTQPKRDVAESWRCCDQGSSLTDCRTRCRHAVSNAATEEDMVDEIITHCGVPDHSAPLWQCFLRLSSDAHRPQEYNVDSARLMCCLKAKSVSCRELCQKTYTTQYAENSHEFHKQCSLRSHEHDLNTCLDQVSNDCQLGCSGLTFCKNFNNRPTEMFKSCSADDDRLANDTFQLWSKGYLTLPSDFDFKISIRDINSCETEMWKSVACVIHIKPCQTHARSNSLCRSDCERLMSHCLDTSTLPHGVDVKFVCEKLFPHSDESSCISILPYLAKVKAPVSSRTEITVPCNPNPCGRNEICVLNTRHCALESDCLPHKCVPGCPLGEAVTQVMPVNSYVRIPSHDLNCYRACRCGRNHRLHHCTSLGCSTQRDCIHKSGRMEAHNSWFNSEDCGSCFCYDGNIICPRCNVLRIAASSTVTDLPCNCEADYNPVCAWDGITYGNPCLAKCKGWRNRKFVSGVCSSIDHCAGISCPDGERCMIIRNSCVDVEEKCKQHACVKTIHPQENLPEGPVTLQLKELIESKEMQNSNAKKCDIEGPVCGLDGNSYSSECSAWEANVPVDYRGVCMNIGRISGNSSTLCTGVKCLPSLSDFCQPLHPPGACCPICGGEIRLLPNPQLVRSASQVMPDKQLVLSDVIEALKNQMKISECSLFGYIFFDGEVIVILSSLRKSPTALQVKGCIVETERIGSLLNSSSPTVTTYLSLSVFMSVNVRTSKLYSDTSVYHNSASVSVYRLHMHLKHNIYHLLFTTVYICIFIRRLVSNHAG